MTKPVTPTQCRRTFLLLSDRIKAAVENNKRLSFSDKVLLLFIDKKKETLKLGIYDYGKTIVEICKEIGFPVEDELEVIKLRRDWDHKVTKTILKNYGITFGGLPKIGNQRECLYGFPKDKQELRLLDIRSIRRANGSMRQITHRQKALAWSTEEKKEHLENISKEIEYLNVKKLQQGKSSE